MGRFYQLSKKISEQEVSEIMREVLELPEIKDAEIVDGKVRVETKDNVFADVDVSCPLWDLLIKIDRKSKSEM